MAKKIRLVIFDTERNSSELPVSVLECTLHGQGLQSEGIIKVISLSHSPSDALERYPDALLVDDTGAALQEQCDEWEESYNIVLQNLQRAINRNDSLIKKITDLESERDKLKVQKSITQATIKDSDSPGYDLSNVYRNALYDLDNRVIRLEQEVAGVRKEQDGLNAYKRATIESDLRTLFVNTDKLEREIASLRKLTDKSFVDQRASIYQLEKRIDDLE